MINFFHFLVIICSMIEVRPQEEKDFILFYNNYVKAMKDDTIYRSKYEQKTYQDYFSTDEKRAKFYYSNQKQKVPSYVVSFPNEEYFKLKIKIEPCKSRGESNCCDGLAICGNEIVDLGETKTSSSEDEVIIDSINAGGDMEIAWIANGFLPICVGDFDDKDCGIFLEIHRPGSDKVLYERKVIRDVSSGYKTEYLSTKDICAGRYDIFFVFRMRKVYNLMYVKPFFVENPSCTCEQVAQAGYECEQ
jgi:hypothetical protein